MNHQPLPGRRGVVAFLLLAFGWSWAFWVPEALVAQGLLASAPDLPALGAFGPTVAAFVLVAYAGGRAGVVGLLRRAVSLDFDRRWLLVPLLLPVAVVGVAILVATATGATIDYPWAGNLVVLPAAYVFILLLGGPVQEEFGWRGYLLDPVQGRLGATGGGVAVGLVWALWHVPLFFAPSQTIYYQRPFLGFLVSITLLSVLMTWVYNNTNGSLLPMLLFHATFNWAQAMFPAIGSDVGGLTFVVVFAAVTLAVVVWWGPTRLVRAAGAAEPRSTAD